MSLIPLGFWGESSAPYQYLAPADYPTYGWSFWKRKLGYTGACIRVRRNSDDTQQDIGFGADNYLDTVALLAFVGPTGNGFLITFYDQFGGINLTNVYVGNQGFMPAVVSAGALITFLDGSTCIQFGQGSGQGYTQIFGGTGVNMVPSDTSTILWSEEAGSSIDQAPIGNSDNNLIFARRAIGVQDGTVTLVSWGNNSLGNYWFNEAKEIENGPLSDGPYRNDLHDSTTYRISIQGARLLASRIVGFNSGTGFTLGGRYDNTNAFFRGKLNECLVYSGGSMSESKLVEVQSVLNASHGFYDINDIQHNLVLWYDAGNTASYSGSGTAITDLSTGGANGTLNNGVSYSSADGGKFVLDGVNDWINTAGTNSNYPWKVGGGDYSSEVWVKFTNINHSARIFGSRNSSTGSQFIFGAGTIDENGSFAASKKISFVISSGNSSRFAWFHTTNDIIDGNWKHIMVTRTSRTLKIFINGIDQPLTTAALNGTSHVYVDTATTWRIADAGGGSGGAGAFDISIIRSYKCNLAQAQVTRNFNLEKSRYGL